MSELAGVFDSVNDVNAEWNNEANILVEDTNYADTALAVAETNDYLEVYNWSQDASLPGGAAISDIKVELRAQKQGFGGGGIPITYCFFNNGSTKQISYDLNGLNPTTYSINGDLTYWGLTNAQAISALTATTAGNGSTVWADEEGSGTITVRFYWYKVTVTYTEAAGGGSGLMIAKL